MQGKLNTIKNVAWALSISVTLLALLLGLLFAAFTPNGGELERPQLVLGAAAVVESAAELPQAPIAAVQTETGRLITLEETEDAGQPYLDSLVFLCDSTTIGLRDYGILSGGISTTQVWGAEGGSLPAAKLGDCLIRYPGDGSQISPAEAAMIVKPAILYVSVGQDGLMGVDHDIFVNNYGTLIRSIREASPGTIIVCCSITSVGPSYSGPDGLTNDKISWGNDWIMEVCKSTGAYFCDVAHDMRDSTNVLNVDYASANLKTLNSAGLNAWLGFIRTHAVQ